MSGEDRPDGHDLAEHRGGEEVDPGAVREQQLRDVASAHVGRGAEPRLPVAAAPVPGGVGESRFARECAADSLEIAMGVRDELANEVAVQPGRSFGCCHA